MYPSVGETIEGKYRIDRVLGQGAMGIVFAATHVLRRAPVALKFMSPAAAALPEAVDRFQNEAIAASQIDSEHVVRIYDVGRFRDLPYLVMEFLHGRDLSHEVDLLQATGAVMPVGRAIHFVLQILRALQVAHERGIVHRDLKPANTFVIERDGEADFVKLVDFGISKQSGLEASASLTRTNTTMGTPLYMAPEQAKSARDADARSDLYSVAAMLYEMLGGRPPHVADNYNLILFKLFQEEPAWISTLRADLPSGLDRVVHLGLTKDPVHRYPSAVAFAQALAPYADERSRGLLTRMLGQRASMVTATGPHAALDATALADVSGSFQIGRTELRSVATTTSGSTQVSTTGSRVDARKSKPRTPWAPIAGAVVAVVVVVGGIRMSTTPRAAPAPIPASAAAAVAPPPKPTEADVVEPAPVKPRPLPPPPVPETEPSTAPSVIPTQAAPARRPSPPASAKPTIATPTPPAPAPIPASPPPAHKPKTINWDIEK